MAISIILGKRRQIIEYLYKETLAEKLDIKIDYRDVYATVHQRRTGLIVTVSFLATSLEEFGLA